MSVNLSPIGNDAPFVDSSGNPLSGGLLYWYTANSSTPQDTYTTSAGNVANANPVVLGSDGYPTVASSVVEIWLTAGVSYKAILKNAAGATLWTRDYISGINDSSASTASEWISGPAPTYIGATSFSLVGDQTSTFQVGRRVKTTNTSGTIYSTISASVFGAATTVTVVNDSGTLDSGLSAVSYSILSATNTAIPSLTDTQFTLQDDGDRSKQLRFQLSGITTATTRTLTVPDTSGTVYLTGGALGTPSSGVLTNATGLPVATGIVPGAANLKLFTNAGATAPEWALGVKIVTTTRDISTASGTQAVTGVGFKPSSVIFYAAVPAGNPASVGADDGSTPSCIFNNTGATAGKWDVNGSGLRLAVDGSNYAEGHITAFGSDGFTITWVKTASPTGTAQIYALCFR